MEGERRRPVVEAGLVAVVVLALTVAAVLWLRGGAERPPDPPAVAPSGSDVGPPYDAGADPATSPAATPTAVGKIPDPAADGRALVAREDFDGATIDRSRWKVYDSLATNRLSRWDPSFVQVRDGQLQIVGEGRDPSGKGNTSGGLCWCYGVGGDRTYGVWQVRARFDAGRGFGQAMLLWPRSDRHPQDGEIDIVEVPNPEKTQAVGVVHWWDGAEHRTDVARAAGDFTRWHIYTVEWRRDHVRMWIDGAVLYDSRHNGGDPRIPDIPMHLAIQQEPGPFAGTWVLPPDGSTPDRVVLHVDWVRVFD